MENAVESSIDREVFRTAQLWNPLPPPEVPAEEVIATAPVERPRLHLIGIILEADHRSAALIHLDTHELLIVSEGDRIEPFVVEEISADRITLAHGDYREQFLVRREEEGR